jgi:predicted TIM-barrel fold metal-dependent hydrolase
MSQPRPPRTPNALLPRGACDCHVHVFGDPAIYPPKPGATYEPPDVTLDDLDRMHATLGIGHAVLVQPAVYGTDHRLLIDSLRQGNRCRGVAVINDSVDDEELEVLHRAGVRGARFNFGGAAQGAFGREEFERSMERIGRLGWHAKIGGAAGELVKHESWLRGIRIPAVLDHLAGIDPAAGMEQPVFRMALDLLRGDNWWVLLANADRRSSKTGGWEDVAPFVQAYVAAAPERTLWATDWPHLLYGKPELPDDAELAEFLQRCLGDSDNFERLLVDNPRQLYGFQESASGPNVGSGAGAP